MSEEYPLVTEDYEHQSQCEPTGGQSEPINVSSFLSPNSNTGRQASQGKVCTGLEGYLGDMASVYIFFLFFFFGGGATINYLVRFYPGQADY